LPRQPVDQWQDEPTAASTCLSYLTNDKLEARTGNWFLKITRDCGSISSLAMKRSR
jgi:hypothetical protein